MENLFKMAIGVIGAVITYLFGGWSTALIALVIFMAADYIMGLVLAGIFKASTKTETGALSSNAGLRGLCKKGVMLLIVLIACQLDKVIGSTFIRDAVIIAFIANETISIIENAGLMGVPIPPVVLKAIDILQKKGDENNGLLK